MSKENGGPAFPVTKSYQERYFDEAGYERTRAVTGLTGGMTLRDYFAANASEDDIRALNTRIPSVDKIVTTLDGTKTVLHNQCPDNWRQIARYMHADLMLAERNRP